MAQNPPQNDPAALPLDDPGLAPKEKTVSGRRKRWPLYRIPLLWIMLFIGAVIGLYFQPPLVRTFFAVTGLEPGGGADDPFVVAVQQILTEQETAAIVNGDVIALGRLRPVGGTIAVAAPFGAGDARIAEIAVTEGQAVARGDLLAVLDNAATLEQAVLVAEAAVSAREAGLAQTRASVQASRDEAIAALELAQSAAENAALEEDRISELFQRGVTTRAELDRAIDTLTRAEREVARLSATLSRFTTAPGQSQPDEAVAEAELASARAELSRAQVEMTKSEVRAPADGMVLSIDARVGQQIPTTGLLLMGDTRRMEAELEVYQTLIGRVSVGDTVTFVTDAVTGPLAGRVTELGLQVQPQDVTSDDQAALTDARVVVVTATLDAEASARAAGLTNLEVIGRIATSDGGTSE